MSSRAVISLVFLIWIGSFKAQQVSKVYKAADLLKRIDTSKTVLVVNFWATWCKPCVQELPAFDSLCKNNKDFKILLVTLDFKEELEKKVNPFLKNHNITCECVLLDEVNGNDYIDKISKDWSGAIPATLIVKKGKKILLEKKLSSKEILGQVK